MMKVFIMLCLTLVVSACTLLKPVLVTPVSTYTLTGVNQNKLVKSPAAVSMLVTMPTASPGYQSTAMIYVTQPLQLSAFAQHRWVAPPAQMLQPLLVTSLRNTQWFSAVVMSPFSGSTDLRLETELVKLQQNFLVQPSEVELVLQVVLMNNATNRVIATKRFSATIATKADNPYAGVVAANQAVTQVMQQLAAFVVLTQKTGNVALPTPIS